MSASAAIRWGEEMRREDGGKAKGMARGVKLVSRQNEVRGRGDKKRKEEKKRRRKRGFADKQDKAAKKTPMSVGRRRPKESEQTTKRLERGVVRR